jgi:fibronectin type 3 domain-containing protein
MAGPASIESDASSATCLTPVDTFPPAAPRGLAAVTGDGGVSLIWEPNTEKDLAGYLVLRGETGAEKLTPITREPIRDTTYRDATVKSGTSYDYVVVAVDNAPLPNTSEYSNRQTAVVP